MKINELVLTINNFDNAAMADDSAGEVCNMLRKLISAIEDNGVISACDGARLMDTNGNQVGEVEVDWEESWDGSTDGCDEVDGVYGYPGNDGVVYFHESGWYVLEGSGNYNQAPDPSVFVDGVNVEDIEDIDCFTSGPADSLESFAEAIWDHLNS